MKSEVFTTIDVSTIECLSCYQMPGKECWCLPEERILRAISDDRLKYAMTDAERKWCIDQADWAGEGMYKKEELEKMDDKRLADTTLAMWSEYARANSD